MKIKLILHHLITLLNAKLIYFKKTFFSLNLNMFNFNLLNNIYKINRALFIILVYINQILTKRRCLQLLPRFSLNLIL